MALGRHLVAALPCSSTAARFILVAGAPSSVVTHTPFAKRAGPSGPVPRIMNTDQPLSGTSRHRVRALNALTLHDSPGPSGPDRAGDHVSRSDWETRPSGHAHTRRMRGQS